MRAISLEEVGEAVNEMKSGKAPGLDGFLLECLKKGGMVVLEWLVKVSLLWPGASQWRIYYHRMSGELSTT